MTRLTSASIPVLVDHNRAAELKRQYDQYVESREIRACTTWMENLSPKDQELLILATTKKVEV